MADKRCFVQFPHPGGEHSAGSGCDWNKTNRPHQRKFMQFCGQWIDAGGNRHRDVLRAWGEWEPESKPISEFDPKDGRLHHPKRLWEPYWVPKSTYRGLHNTDPFIFGDRFLYSNCGQAAPSKAGLRRLGEGSVIAFGSGKKVGGESKWVLDTVLVVKDSIPYDPLEPRKALQDQVPETFLNVTGGPLGEDSNLAKEPVEGGLRLYRGATPDDPVCGMYSFFPARPAGDDSCFPRPAVCLDRNRFNPRNWQAPKGITRHLSIDELCRLWTSLVAQVRRAGHVIGTHAQLPNGQEPAATNSASPDLPIPDSDL